MAGSPVQTRAGQVSESAGGGEHGSRKRRKPDELHIKKAANGGFIVRHSYDNFGAGESYMPPKEHAFGSHKDMMAHVSKHTGGGYNEGFDGDEGGKKGETEPDADDKGTRKAGVGRAMHGRAPNQRTYGAGVD